MEVYSGEVNHRDLKIINKSFTDFDLTFILFLVLLQRANKGFRRFRRTSCLHPPGWTSVKMYVFWKTSRLPSSFNAQWLLYVPPAKH
jgi:hypothetical protein